MPQKRVINAMKSHNLNDDGASQNHVYFRNDLSVRTMLSQLSAPRINLVVSKRPFLCDRLKTSKLSVNQNHSFDVRFMGEMDRARKLEISDQISASVENIDHRILIMDDIFDIYEAINHCSNGLHPYFSLRSISPADISRVKSTVSAEWHRDAAAVTFVVCYAGDASHWSPNSNVRREYFEHRQMQVKDVSADQCLVNKNFFYCLKNFDISVLKGELRHRENDKSTVKFYEDRCIDLGDKNFNVGRGLIHRGPGLSSKKQRLLFTVSFFTQEILS